MALRDDEVEGVLDWVERHDVAKLTDWEATFVDDIRRRFDDRGFLTENQKAKLDEIFERYREER